MKMKSAGFTIIELLVVIAIIAILTAAGIMGGSGVLGNIRFGNAFNKTMFMTQQARSLAKTSGNSSQQYGIKFETGASGYSVIEFADANLNGIYDASTDTLVENYVLPAGLVISGDDLASDALSDCALPIIILFRNGAANTILQCTATPPSAPANIKISVKYGETAKSFSIHRASGIPQVL